MDSDWSWKRRCAIFIVHDEIFCKERRTWKELFQCQKDLFIISNLGTYVPHAAQNHGR